MVKRFFPLKVYLFSSVLLSKNPWMVKLSAKESVYCCFLRLLKALFDLTGEAEKLCSIPSLYPASYLSVMLSALSFLIGEALLPI